MVLQRWEGFVIEMGKDTFTARLVPIVGEGGDLEAEIYADQIHPDDVTLIRPGALFYWTIDDQARSLIRFRRLPPWMAEEIDRARAEGIEMQTLFADEGEWRRA